MKRRLAALLAVLALAFIGLPATARANADLPAYGIITIIDPGTGPRANWYYPFFDCTSSIQGPNGVPQTVTVTCTPGQTVTTGFDCPEMILSRTTDSVVGARASCGSTLEMGVGTSGISSADLGHVYLSVTCEAYVDVGVLVPPYSVTCNEPGLPTSSSALTSTVTG